MMLKMRRKRMKTEKISASKARGVIALILLLFIFQVVTFILHKVELAGEASAAASVVAVEGENSALVFSPAPTEERIAEAGSAGNSRRSAEKAARKKQKPLVELNSADSVELLSIRGVGPFYARQIIKYRERLGGYVRPEQLLELYKMDRERYEPIAEQITVDVSRAVRIDFKQLVLNEEKESVKSKRDFLGRHPYVGYRVLKGIELYMKSLGTDSLLKVSSAKLLDAFLKNNLITEVNYKRLLLYVKD